MQFFWSHSNSIKRILCFVINSELRENKSWKVTKSPKSILLEPKTPSSFKTGSVRHLAYGNFQSNVYKMQHNWLCVPVLETSQKRAKSPSYWKKYNIYVPGCRDCLVIKCLSHKPGDWVCFTDPTGHHYNPGTGDGETVGSLVLSDWPASPNGRASGPSENPCLKKQGGCGTWGEMVSEVALWFQTHTYMCKCTHTPTNTNTTHEHTHIHIHSCTHY